MFFLGFRRKMTALALCKSIESAIQWFQIHHRTTFATIQNPAIYLSGARVSIFSTLVPRLLVIICWERTDLLALLFVMFPCVFATFQYGFSGKVWYLILSIPDLCHLLYFE